MKMWVDMSFDEYEEIKEKEFRRGEAYGRMKMDEEKRLHFDVDSDSGVYLTTAHILRDPEWRDVWSMFKDWILKRPRHFPEPRVRMVSK